MTQHPVPPHIPPEIITLMIWCVVIVILCAIGLAILKPIMNEIDGPKKHRPLKRTPNLIQPTARVYGRGRKLREIQTPFCAADPQPAALPPQGAASPQQAFEYWFEDSIELPEVVNSAHRIPCAELLENYVDYCDHHHHQRLSEEAFFEALCSNAAANHCDVDAKTGDFVGGHFRNC